MKFIKFILSFVSVLGAVLNGYGLGTGNLIIGLLGQVVWISSNSGWVIKKLHEEEYSEVVMFLSFWISAVYSVSVFILNS